MRFIISILSGSVFISVKIYSTKLRLKPCKTGSAIKVSGSLLLKICYMVMMATIRNYLHPRTPVRLTTLIKNYG